MMYTPISPISSVSSAVDSIPSLGSYDSLLVEDQLEVMLEQEAFYQVTCIPCTEQDNEGAARPHEEWRRKICEWSYRVVDHFRIEREVVSVSMNLFDRYLSLQKPNCTSSCQCPSCQRAVDSRTFQLSAMTALYMGIKIHAESSGHDSQRKRLRLSSMVDLSRGQFSAEDICKMERDMLAGLSWRVNPITPSNIVAYLLRLMPPHSQIPRQCQRNYDLSLHVLNELARYLSELSVCLANVGSAFLPSEIAYASILVAMELLTPAALPFSVRDRFSVAVANMMVESNMYLMNRLRASFWPEMLINECGDHPMALARDLGLLDLDHLYRKQTQSFDGNCSITSVMDVQHPQRSDHLSCITP
mmetsp:Transcript_8548/g.14203  ORF Transcript_8548/g.14203 Transcript_8548/m.14203 type:complete len:359 (+) Transcript_8548:47-1123(+)